MYDAINFSKSYGSSSFPGSESYSTPLKSDPGERTSGPHGVQPKSIYSSLSDRTLNLPLLPPSQKETGETVDEGIRTIVGTRKPMEGGRLATATPSDFYKGEDKGVEFRGEPKHWQPFVDQESVGGKGPEIEHLRTHYMDEGEKRSTELTYKDGKLVTAKGEYLDTSAKEKLVPTSNGGTRMVVESGPTGIGTQNQAGTGKHIFVMTPEGEIRQTDPWASKVIDEREVFDEDIEVDIDRTSLGFINHSSFVSGGAVAGAGELTVEEGELLQVSDSSGHYLPNGKLVQQTLREFERQGVDVRGENGLGVDVKLVAKRKQDGGRPLYVSAKEFLLRSEEKGGPKRAEAKIRDFRDQLKAEIQDRHKGFQKRVAYSIPGTLNMDRLKGRDETRLQRMNEETKAFEKEQTESRRSALGNLGRKSKMLGGTEKVVQLAKSNMLTSNLISGKSLNLKAMLAN